MEKNSEIEKLQSIITQQKHQLEALEKELKETKEKVKTNAVFLKNILEDLPENVYWLDTEGRTICCNHHEARILGFSHPDEIIGKNIYDLAEILGWEKDIADKIRQNDFEVMQTGKEKRVEEKIILDGQEKIYLSIKKPFYNENGVIAGIFGIAVDITERKSLEKALILAQEKANNEKLKFNIYLDNILAHVPEHLYWMDKNDVVLGCNDRQAQSLGLKDKSALIGRSLEEIGRAYGWTKEMINSLRKNNQEIMETRKGKIVEETSIYNDEEKTLLSYKNPIINRQNEVIGILGITVDITERKKLEKELVAAKDLAVKASQAKSEFMMNMSHDIRTPLNGILGFSQILLSKENDSIKKEHLAYILTSGRRLLNLLNEIIDLTQLEQGMPIKQSFFDIREVIQELYELLLAEIKQKNLELHILISDQLPKQIYCDKTRVNRILLNLLGNAIKFTAKGSISLIINFENSLLTIEIKDTGIGIPEDKLELIFNKFTRLTSSYQGVYTGSGIGLHIVKTFLEDLGGNIQVKSSSGKGTVFTCVIPLKAND